MTKITSSYQPKNEFNVISLLKNDSVLIYSKKVYMLWILIWLNCNKKKITFINISIKFYKIKKVK